MRSAGWWQWWQEGGGHCLEGRELAIGCLAVRDPHYRLKTDSHLFRLAGNRLDFYQLTLHRGREGFPLGLLSPVLLVRRSCCCQHRFGLGGGLLEVLLGGTVQLQARGG